MKIIPIAALVLTTFLAFACASTPAADKTSLITVTPVARTDHNMQGQPLAIPSGDIEVVVSRCEIKPGASLPVHKHPYQRYAYVLSGHLRVFCDGAPSADYVAGDFLADPVDVWHYAQNTGAEPTVLLLIDHVPKGRGNTVKK